MKCAIYVEAATPKTAEKLERIVMKILSCSAGDEVKKEALRVVADALSTHASISNCSFKS